ncbi:MAG: hypothetical protein RL318_1565 [Fibrobacterota bacterium]|jgi:2-dehydropantoate 2-reductase
MEIETVLIAGAGAVGTLVATQFQRAMPGKVGILAGGERLARYRRQGFTVNGTPVDFRFVEVGSGETFDLVIVACKDHHLPDLLTDLESHVGPRTLILSLLNGITSEAKIGAKYGPARLPYAMIVGTDAGFVNGALDYCSEGLIVFGDARNETPWSPRVAAIAHALDRAAIRYQVPEDMLGRLWYKFMFNVGINQVSAVLRRPFRTFKGPDRNPHAFALMDTAMREARAVACAEGIPLTEVDIELVWKTVDTLSDHGQTSMLQDVLAGRKTEVELFSQQVIALAERHGLEVPVNRALFGAIRAIETSYGEAPQAAVLSRNAS